MINNPLFEIKENIIIEPATISTIASNYFACEISANELAWLEKKHINKYLTAHNEPNDDCLYNIDMQNAF